MSNAFGIGVAISIAKEWWKGRQARKAAEKSADLAQLAKEYQELADEFNAQLRAYHAKRLRGAK